MSRTKDEPEQTTAAAKKTAKAVTEEVTKSMQETSKTIEQQKTTLETTQTNPQTQSQTQLSWLDRLSNALLREPQDLEQLVTILRDAHERHLLDADALSMIEGVLQVSELQVRDIMIPRSQMVVIDEEEEFEAFLPRVIASGHSRFPIVSSDRDSVIGIIHAKDLLRFHPCVHQVADEAAQAAANATNINSDAADTETEIETESGVEAAIETGVTINVRDLARPAVIVPESKHLDALLKEFKTQRNHMAVVVDEYGVMAGCVTIEDIIEQIVGDIEDEFDYAEEANIKQHAENDYIVKAHTPIEDFNEYFSELLGEDFIQFSDEEFDTIGGFIANKFGHMPKRGEKLSYSGFKFKVLHADQRRIRLLEVTLK